MGLTNPDISNMISMCASCDSDTLRDQVPQRMVYLNGFWVDQTEVTNAQFEKFVRDTGYQTTAEQEGGSYLYDLQYRDFFYFKGTFWRYPQGVSSSITGRSDYPVLHASWDDAVAYCRWAGRRLPTEAEWEKAARGTNGLIFPWGNYPPNLQLLNFDRIVGAPSPVGSYPSGASPYGVLDMAGNLYEWVSDFYKESYYPEAPEKNPTGPISGEGHTLRGGSWATGAENKLLNLSTTFRIWNKPFIRSDVIGFRCAMSTSALP